MYLYTQHIVGHLVISFGSTKPSATPWRWGRSQSLQRLGTFTLWRGCFPENSLLNSVSAKTSRHEFYVVRIGKKPLHYWSATTTFEWEKLERNVTELGTFNLISLESVCCAVFEYIFFYIYSVYVYVIFTRYSMRRSKAGKHIVDYLLILFTASLQLGLVSISMEEICC